MVLCAVIQKTLHLILRCAAPLFYMPTIYYKDFGALHLPSFLWFTSTTLKAAEPRNICRNRMHGYRQVQPALPDEAGAPKYYHFEFFSKPYI